MRILHAAILALLLSATQGCATGADLFKELAKDRASFCGYSTVAYGGFTVTPTPMIPGMGVYLHQRFCRSNEPGSTVEAKPDGTLSIQHGMKPPQTP